MKKTVRYVATGLVLGNLWGGGSGLYDMDVLEADTKEELIQKANEGLENGSLDSGIDFESLRGAVLDITIETTIVFEDEEYINEKYQFDSVGNLTDTELENMEKILLET